MASASRLCGEPKWPNGGGRQADVIKFARGSRLTSVARRWCEGPRAESQAVDLWVAPAALDSALLKHSSILDAEDRAAGEAVRHRAQRQRSQATKVLLRLVLSSHLEGAVLPDQWRFRVDDGGKPSIRDSEIPINFSLSHNEAATVIAVSGAAPVGVDIEMLDQPIDDDMLAFFLSPRERASLQDLGGVARQEAFLKLWTLKEAYTKLLGVGLNAEFSTLEFGLDPVCLLNAASLPVQFGTWCLTLNQRPCQISLACASDHGFPLASNLRLLNALGGTHTQSQSPSVRNSSSPSYRVGNNHGICNNWERAADG